MDFQVLPRRKFRKTTLGLVAFLVMSLTLISLLTGIIELLANPHAHPQFGSGLGYVIVIGFLVYSWKLRRQQRELQQALQKLDLVRLTKDGKVGLFLFLRSFRLGRSTLLRRLMPWAYGDQSLIDATIGLEAFHFEEDISNAIHPHLLIAIGDRGDSYGAGKVIVSDDKWKDHFNSLATHSWVIFMQPDLTQSVRWEVGQLLGNESYLRKTVWVMPRSGTATWTEIQDGFRKDIDLALPPHHGDGGVFRLRPDSGDLPVVPKIFVSTLTSVLEEAKQNGQPFAIERLWERALDNDRHSRANDQALRELHKKRRRLVKFR